MRVLGLALAAALAACGHVDPFACSSDDACAPGRCEAAGACSFADTSCHAGWRYGGGGDPALAGRCVGSESGALAQVAAGSEHACARGDDGRVWCWGNDKYGGLGRPGGDVPAPVIVDGVAGVTQLDGGEFHTCALAGGQVWCWGADAQGELGDGEATDQPVPQPAQVTGLANVVAIDLGEYHSCALDGDGAVWCWGRNKDEEIGQDNASYQWHPVRVNVPTAKAISAGGQEGCAITTGDDVWCWGKNDSGQLGVPGNGRTKPTLVPAFHGAAQVAVGGDHACARFPDGHVACTGADDHGQLGDGTTTSTHTPVTVVGLDDAVEIAALDWSTCARKRDGSVVCWGEGDHGELGVGASDVHAPGAAVPLPAPAAQLAAGESFACALDTGGCLWCWGLDTAGELGDGPGSPGGVRPVLLGACNAAPAP
jgi:alpha-tubulin suppressor-like RCC1 family protein